MSFVDDEPKHELITYNKKFKPGTAGVKLTFSPDEMAFSREDMPLRAAIARREVLLSLQPQIDGVSKKPWNNDVLVLNPKVPYNPQDIHVTSKAERDPDFRRDFYDTSLPWDGQTSIDQKLERRQFRKFTEESRTGTIRACKRLENEPLLVTRQIRHAKEIKEHGIPAAQPPPPVHFEKPKMSPKSAQFVKKHEKVTHFHDGVFAYNEAFGGEAWSCCGNSRRDSQGCRTRKENDIKRRYE